jgi:threonine dehydratase
MACRCVWRTKLLNDHLTLQDFEAARDRIRGRVRETPMFDPRPHGAHLDGGAGAHVLLKLECLQASGSFKTRGAMHKLSTLSGEALAAGLITASGGNHGMAVAWAAGNAGVPATVYLPESTPAAKADALRALGAEVIIEGAVWDDANAAALKVAKSNGATYVHPFADPAIIAGQGTLGLEIMEQAADADTIIVAIGGGGLMAGVARAVKAVNPAVKLIGVEPTGAPTLYESLKAKELVTLDAIETTAGSLAPRRSMPLNYELISANVDRVCLVSDEEMRNAAQLLWRDFGIATELAGAASVAALMTGRHVPQPGERVVAIVCGAGKDGF